MNSNQPTGKIGQLLAGTYRDPDSGNPIGVTTKSLVIAASLDGMEGGPHRRPRLRQDDCRRQRRDHAWRSRPAGRDGARRQASRHQCRSAERRPSRRRDGSEGSGCDHYGGCADRGGLGHHQRSQQVRQRAGREALRGLRHGAVDERLHLGQRGHHDAWPQDVAAGAGAARRVLRSLDPLGGAAAPGSRGPRRQPLPHDVAGRLAAGPPALRSAVPRSCPTTSSPTTSRRCSPIRQRCSVATRRSWRASFAR